MRTTSFLSIVSIFIASLTAAQAGGVSQLLKAKVSGTVQTQQVVGSEQGKIKTSAVNNQRIFSEFGVSDDDYELVVSISGPGLYLIPRNSGSPLPSIEVIIFSESSGLIIDTKKRALSYIATALNESSTTNLFDGLVGTATGTFRYDGTFPAADYKSAQLNVVARGTDQGGESETAILKLKITTTGKFTQTGGPL